MKDMINKYLNSSIVFYICTLVIGIIAMFYPNFTIKALGIVFAIYALVKGISLIYTDITLKEFRLPFETLIPGILSIVCSIILFKEPDILQMIIPLVVGTWIIVENIMSLKLSIVMQRISSSSWIWVLILSIIDIILGFMLLFDPFSSVAITTVVGIILAVESIVGIIDCITIKKNAKEI